MERETRVESAEHSGTYTADGIVVLEGLEAVRRRPGMYVGDTRDGTGLHHLLWEVVANSIDEHLAGHATRLRVSVEGSLAEVEDDGRGIPVDWIESREASALEVILTCLFAGSTRDGHLPHVHVAPSGCGVGLAPVNALSERLNVEIRRGGHVWRQRYACGRPVTALERGARTERTGTTLRFQADRSIFGGAVFDRDAIRERLEELAIWNPSLQLELMAQTIRESRGTVAWLERLAARTRTLRGGARGALRPALRRSDTVAPRERFGSRRRSRSGAGRVRSVPRRAPSARARTLGAHRMRLSDRGRDT
jgi:DNA gyrase subunit B